MFFNCNWCGRPCCCGGCDKGCKKTEKNYCDIKDQCCYDNKYDKYNRHDYDKHEKSCYRTDVENKYRKNDDFDRFDKYCQYPNNFGAQSYYGEYNNLGHFNHEDKSNEKEFDRNGYNKEYDIYYIRSADRQFPNWDNDKDCKCKKDKDENKCCKPVKYICFPWDRY